MNFDNLYNAYVTVFAVMIGDDWNLIMYDYKQLYYYGATFYFIFLVIITQIVMLNLLLAILISNFN
jgi:hypothetical protein